MVDVPRDWGQDPPPQAEQIGDLRLCLTKNWSGMKCRRSLKLHMIIPNRDLKCHYLELPLWQRLHQPIDDISEHCHFDRWSIAVPMGYERFLMKATQITGSHRHHHIHRMLTLQTASLIPNLYPQLRQFRLPAALLLQQPPLRRRGVF